MGRTRGVVGAVELSFPGGAGASKALPLSSVTLCATPSMLCTLTFAPGLTGAGVMNAKSWIVMTAAVAVGVPVPAAGAGPADGAVEPQLVRATRAMAPWQDVTASLVDRSGPGRPCDAAWAR
jgi:hypothetical protein